MNPFNTPISSRTSLSLSPRHALQVRAPKQTQQTLHWFLSCSDQVHLTKFPRKSPFSQPWKHYSNSIQQTWQLKGQNFKNTFSIAYWHDPLNAWKPKKSVAMQQGCYLTARLPTAASALHALSPCSWNMRNAAGCSPEVPVISCFTPHTKSKGNFKKPTWFHSLPSWESRGMPTTQPCVMIHCTFY